MKCCRYPLSENKITIYEGEELISDTTDGEDNIIMKYFKINENISNFRTIISAFY